MNKPEYLNKISQTQWGNMSWQERAAAVHYITSGLHRSKQQAESSYKTCMEERAHFYTGIVDATGMKDLRSTPRRADEFIARERVATTYHLLKCWWIPRILWRSLSWLYFQRKYTWWRY